MTTNRSTWALKPLDTADDATWAAVTSLDAHAFGDAAPPELLEAVRELHEPGRGIGAYDGEELVGLTTAYSYRLSVPGATMPAAGVTWVGVLPTHRRRGVLTALMDHQLYSLHQAGQEPIAVLWASEPAIYGRFGYGSGTSKLRLTVPRSSAALRVDAPRDPDLRLRLADPAADSPIEACYATVAGLRPGAPERDARWWREVLRDLPALREGRSPLRLVLAEDDHGVRGYALYTTKQDWVPNGPLGVVSVREVLAIDVAARAALYRYLFDLDLIASTELGNVPVDDPLLLWLADRRRAKPILGDALYVRLVDLPGALAGRTYASELDVVLEVTDPRCEWNAGRWRLRGGPAGAACERTRDEPDLALDVGDLGAAFLGGTRLVDLGAAGRVREQHEGVLAATSHAFAHHPAPWTPAIF